MGGRSQYKTRQYNLIMGYLASLGENEHTSIPQMVAHFKETGTPVGTATLYRQLEKLAAEGRVRKFTLEGRAGARYQYQPGHKGCNAHFHLKCEGCGSLVHLDCEETRAFQQHVLESHGFVANYSKTVIYGLCKHCAGKGPKAGQTEAYSL